MMLPVSSYEELLARVRSLTSETIQLRHEITTSLQSPTSMGGSGFSASIDHDHHVKNHSVILPRTSLSEDMNTGLVGATGGADRTTFLLDKKVNEIDNEFKEIDEKLISPVGNDKFHQNGWSSDTLGLWHSGPSSLNLGQTSSNHAPLQDLTLSVSSNSQGPQSLNSFSSSSKRTYSHQQLGAKVEMVYSLLSMLDTDNREDMSKTFLAMSSSAESCHAMRQSGCLPLLIQLIHSHELNKDVRKRAAEALHNIVHAQSDEKRRRREVRVLKLLQQVREYCDELISDNGEDVPQLQESDKHPINAIGTLMKFSFDAEHRQAICILGGLHAITQLLQVDHEAHGSTNDDSNCITLRRYAGMSLTNLTFGDGKNKALLCSFNKFMRALVDQLKSPSEDLRQVTASVLRNLSWRADSESKQALRNVGAVTALTVSAMEAKKESTLKSILSALWNLSAHCSLNKIDICSVPGALAFLVKMLRYKSTSNTLAIVENAGGILRNISSHIAVREDYRQILRDNNCFEVLLEQLKSPSLTVVSNACGTLWNLSARCAEDQKRLWEMGATTMLRSLVQSKHKMISMGSSAALKNLLTANPDENLLTHLDSTAKSLGLQNLPTLFVRKKKALEQELNITLAETCENIDPTGSPTHSELSQGKTLHKRSESRDSVQSSQSDSVYERINQITHKNEEKVLENKNVTLHDSLDEKSMPRKVEEQKLMRRYKTSMIPTPTFKKMNQDRINEKTKEESVVEDRDDEIVDDTCLKGKDLKQKNKKGIPVLDSRVKSKSIQRYEISDENECFVSRDVEKNTVKSYSRVHVDDVIGENQMKNEQESVPGYAVGDEKVSDSCERVGVDCRNATEEHNEEEIRDDQSGNLSNEPAHVTRLVLNYDQANIKELKEAGKTGGSSSNVSKETISKEAKFTPEDNLSQVETAVAENRLRNPTPSHVSTISQQSTDMSKLQDEIVEQTVAEKHEPTLSSTVANQNFTSKPKQSKLDILMDSERNQSTISDTDVDDLKTPTGTILPKFKVGSPITDSSVLQMEAKKICREIRKQQDFEMGCSLTSEVSLISCSSFLDTGDYSLFESSTDGIDFEDSENLLLGKNSKMKNFPLRKTNISQTGEPISLPSLGSLKNEQLDALDLDNSVLSVASITSEIAETNSKDFEAFNTYTKTYKNADAENELIEDTAADVTLVSNGDDTLNADSLQNVELFDEDNSLHSQENLPLDSENVQVDRSSEMINKKLTPKEKRKTFQERYRTYTIRNYQNSDIKGPIPEVPCAQTTNQPTYNANTYNIRQKNEEKWNERLEKYDLPSTALHKGGKYEKYYFSKSFDKERDVAPDFLADSRSLTDLLTIGPAERKELVDNAKLVAFSLKTAIHDGEMISDSEDDHKSIEIDTATYSKSNRDRFLGRYSTPVYQPVEQYEEDPEEDLEKKGARILKPGDKPIETLELSKGIRGRRKPLYTSPRKTVSRDSSTNSPKTSKMAIPVKKTLTEASSSPALHREGTFTKEDVPDVKKVEAKIPRPTSAIPKNGLRPPNKIKTAGIPRRVAENQASKIGRPLSTYAARYSERRSESESSQRRPFSAGSASRIGGDKAPTATRSASSGLTSPKMRTSSSNQNIKAGNSSGGVKSKNQTLQSSKSQSDASLNFVASKDKDTTGADKTPKKEVTSKIASLWRKVEESKQKNQNVKDNRVWICPEKNINPPDDVLVVEKEEILDIPTRKIVHSYTCQALAADETSQFCSQETDPKIGREYTHVRGTEERGRKTEKRNIISAVIPPYNYNPPVSAQPTKIKQVDAFHNGSLKVTTV